MPFDISLIINSDGLRRAEIAQKFMRESPGPMSARPLSGPPIFAALAALGLAACSSAPAASSADFAADAWAASALADAPYLLAPGDKIEVIVHTAPETGIYRMQDDGSEHDAESECEQQRRAPIEASRVCRAGPGAHPCAAL